MLDFFREVESLLSSTEEDTPTSSSDLAMLQTRYAEERGIRVLRFWNTDVLQNIDGVLERILEAVRPPHPNLPAGGRR